MPDYTLCTNKDCPIKSECRRSIQNTEPSKYKQTYQCFQYTISVSGAAMWLMPYPIATCDYFIPIGETPQNKEK